MRSCWECTSLWKPAFRISLSAYLAIGAFEPLTTAEAASRQWLKFAEDSKPTSSEIGQSETTYRSVSAGLQVTCAVTNTGAAKCWGDNQFGQLGNGTKIDSPVPVDVTGLSAGVRAIVLGDVFNCALTDEGGVKCWGENRDGQLGNGTKTDSVTPVDVSGLSSGVGTIVTDSEHVCALTTAGAVKCWGWNYQGVLGDGTKTDSATPVDVIGLSSGVSTIVTRLGDTCVLTTAGGVKCWGDNSFGQLGIGTITTDSRVPVDVLGLSTGVRDIVMGWFFTCALMDEGGVKCWGSAQFGHLGNGLTGDYNHWHGPAEDGLFAVPAPVDVWGYNNTVKASVITTAVAHSCVLSNYASLKCWGPNESGQLGNGEISHPAALPVGVIGLRSDEVRNLVVAREDTCAVTKTGAAKCWGDNQFGQLGNGTKIDSPVPVDVTGLSAGVTAIALSGDHTCALTSAGEVKCWGHNNHGQLGDGSTTDRLTPVDVR